MNRRHLLHMGMAGSNKSRFKPTPILKKQSAASRTLSPRRQLEFLAITDLNRDHRNPRKHDRAQIRAIARSIETFGFNAPILIDKSHRILAGYGRSEAAKVIGWLVRQKSQEAGTNCANSREYVPGLLKITMATAPIENPARRIDAPHLVDPVTPTEGCHATFCPASGS
jgi:hypothetical protein